MSWLLSTLFPSMNYQEVNMTFLKPFIVEADPSNGFVILNKYIPEEILLKIFTYLDPKDILKCSLVCKTWFNITRSNILWHEIYNLKEHSTRAKNLPWYVFYNYLTTENYTNLIKNGNGEEQFNHWTIVSNGGDGFIIENEPVGSDPLPQGVPEFHGHTSCFATSFYDCCKYQKIDLSNKRLLKHIINRYKPSIYLSEWFAGRFDCSCIYKLGVVVNSVNHKWKSGEQRRFHHWRERNNHKLSNSPFYLDINRTVESFQGKEWEKVELVYNNYSPYKIDSIGFVHGGRDDQFWKGHYGSKMAGGVLKFDFASIQPLPEDESFSAEMCSD
ncbi:F-box only protein 6-like [Anthonomus grandis grandis]|uniref:F-box only protein 6-like n=1 Tax=Anthonomus grandis grandis TaxID=2921223 RepID=UPI002166669D|nr:F-box only protein 6-like [Anthonomus grandis grandis]